MSSHGLMSQPHLAIHRSKDRAPTNQPPSFEPVGRGVPGEGRLMEMAAERVLFAFAFLMSLLALVLPFLP